MILVCLQLQFFLSISLSVSELLTDISPTNLGLRIDGERALRVGVAMDQDTEMELAEVFDRALVNIAR